MSKAKAESDSLQEDWVLEEMLKVAMEDEKTDREKYRRLARLAERERDAKQLYAIADDDAQHRRVLEIVFVTLFGKDVPKTSGIPQRVAGFTESIRKSIVSEYEGASFYREILARLSSAECKTVMRRLMADKQEHARVLEGILTKRTGCR